MRGHPPPARHARFRVRLAPYEVPRVVLFVDEPPRRGVGEVPKRTLAEPLTPL